MMYKHVRNKLSFINHRVFNILNTFLFYQVESNFKIKLNVKILDKSF